ncbi:MAG: SlyX family protein [Proteobacteria bacterium]|nr:SlyX family protein [Pseudomonadota bacterium]
MSNIENKIIELETKFAFAEQTIEELNDVIIKHQKTLDKLAVQMQQLNAKIEEESQSWHADNNPADETPPHY